MPNNNRNKRLEPLAAVAAIFISGNATSDHFRLQVIATVASLTEEDLRELARTIIDVSVGEDR